MPAKPIQQTNTPKNPDETIIQKPKKPAKSKTKTTVKTPKTLTEASPKTPSNRKAKSPAKRPDEPINKPQRKTKETPKSTNQPIIQSTNQPKYNLTDIQTQASQMFAHSVAREFLLVGGSRSGKSFVIVHQQLKMAVEHPGSRHLIARFRFNHAKNSIWLDTLKKVIRLCYSQFTITWRNTDYYLELENGSQIWLAGLDDKDRTEKILGMEFLTVFLNEASQISYEAYTTIKTRLAQKIDGALPLLFVDANPPSKKHWMYRVFVQFTDPESNTGLTETRYQHLLMNPHQNTANISADYLETLNSLPLRKRKRFRDGEFADDSEGALWTADIINANRLRRYANGDLPVSLKRIVIAIDPAVSSKDTSDETGIIVAGLGFDNHLYVIDDMSGIYTPTEWAARAVALYNHYRADRIIGEVNNGGDLIETVLRGVDSTVSYKGVHATRDKLTRAEPIAAIYEQGKAHHIEQHLELELEMTSWEAQKGERSPNRIDALVWAATELCLRPNNITGKAKYHFLKKPERSRYVGNVRENRFGR